MPRLPENLEVLRDGAFRRLLGAAAVSWFGDRMVVVALAFAVLEGGGSASAITDRAEVLAIYAFLRKALLAVDAARPFRGPAEFVDGDFRYLNTVNGDVAAFNGEEQILKAGSAVYALRYQGGLMR